jgi:hypothetical protein
VIDDVSATRSAAEPRASGGAELADALLDLCDTCSTVSWSYALKHTSASSEAHRAVVDAFGTAAEDPTFFRGPVSPLVRLLPLIRSAARARSAPASLSALP